MRWTLSQLADYEARHRVQNPNALVKDSTPVERESDLHAQIIDWCNSQWPRRPYIHSRMDQRSTVAVGLPDFVIFLNDGKVLCIECKRRGGKRTIEQLAWALQLDRLGHTIHLVYSYDEFLAVVKKEMLT